MIEIIGHRGSSAHAPENTVRAFDRAIDEGADRIELDLQRSADGEVFVFHDITLERLTQESGAACLRPIDDLRRLAVLPSLHEEADDTRIPDLHGVLERFGETVPFYLEIKADGSGTNAGDLDALVDACLEGIEGTNAHHLASFDVQVIRRVIEAGRRPVLIASDPRRFGELTPREQVHVDAYSVFHERIDESVVTMCRERDLPLWAWTVDREDDLDRLLALGHVRAVCTNDVARMRGWLRDRGLHA